MFETTIVNKRSEKATLRDETGRVICALAPNDSIILDSENDRTVVAPFESIVFEKGGAIKFQKRDNWVDPYDPKMYRVEILNADGAELYSRVVGGQTIFLPRGLPVIHYLDPEDPDARYERIEIRRVERRVKHPMWPGYYGMELALEEVKTERSEEELKKLDDEIEKRLKASEPQADADTTKAN